MSARADLLSLGRGLERQGAMPRAQQRAVSCRAATLLAMSLAISLASALGCSPSGLAGDDPTGTGGAPSPGGTGGTGGVTAAGSGGVLGTGGSPGRGGAGGPGTGGSVSTPGTGGLGTGNPPDGGLAATGGGGGGGAGGAAAAGTGGSAAGSGGATGGTGGAAAASGGASMGGAGGSGGAAGEISPCATNELSRCTGTNPVQCHFGGTPGNYEVTVELGGAAAGSTYVDVEAYRKILPETTTAAGETKRFSFVANVRVYESEPVRPDDNPSDAYTAGSAGLDVYFRGTMPRVTAVCTKVATPRPVMLWMAGDSTTTDQQAPAFGGWPQHLPQHFVAPISVANYSDSGESSGSSLGNARLWGAIKAGMRAGDWVFIQFGHNDEKNGVAGFNSYKANLATMVSDAKAVGANPVLVTPISRATGGSLAVQHVVDGNSFPQAVRDLGAAQNVPVIDLTTRTWEWLQTINFADYFANGTDRTHTNHRGADAISIFVRDAVRARIPGLARYLR